VHRDLADPHPWEASLERSLARRHAARTPAPARWASRRAAGALALVAVGAAPLMTTAADTQAAPKASAAASPTLDRGDRGAAVRQLQRLLHVRADGIFGADTARAVRRFQRRHRMRVDGIVGPATWRVLRRSSRAGGGGRVLRMIRAANRIAHKPYKYGGGHGQWTDSGYDCSGAVSYVLHAAGLLGGSRTADKFMGYGIRGRGRHVTIYANGGHVFMVINGRRFDTTGRNSSGSFWQPRMRDAGSFVARHPAGL
jgi:cell wall-associated NlpC family hydrolase